MPGSWIRRIAAAAVGLITGLGLAELGLRLWAGDNADAWLHASGATPPMGFLVTAKGIGVEPAATGQNLTRIVDALGGRKAFWTGISAPLQIGMGTTDQVREAVRDAHALFGRRGFLLAAVPSIRRHWPWENVEAMMDEHARIEQEIPRSLCQ